MYTDQPSFVKRKNSLEATSLLKGVRPALSSYPKEAEGSTRPLLG